MKPVEQTHPHHLGRILIICLLGIVIYSNTLHSPFVLDDTPNIEKNTFIRLTDLDLKGLWDAGLKSPCPNRPLANVSFALNYYFGRYDVTGYHVVNILIHVINGILVYFVALTVLRNSSNGFDQKASRSPVSLIPAVAFLSALLFTAHPLQTQSVTYIVQRMNSMAVLFYLLSFLLYIHGRLSKRISTRSFLLSGCVISWVLALSSKEIAVTLPFLLFLYEWYFVQDLSIVWLRRNMKYFLASLVILCLLAYVYIGDKPLDAILATYQWRDFTIRERVLTQFRVIVFYVGLLLYPHPSRLNVTHPFPVSQSLLEPVSTLFSLLFVLGLIGVSIYLARPKRVVSFCILFFLIHLAVESSVIGLEMVFEHRLYLPMLGFALVVSYLLFCLFSRRPYWSAGVSILIVASLGTGTHARNGIWQDRVTLWTDSVSKAPESPRAHNNLGLALMGRGETDDAITHFSEALKIKPDHAAAHNNMGVAFLEKGDLDPAVRHFSLALQVQPQMWDARNNLGLALMDQGRLDEAASHFARALTINPDMAEAHFNLGTALKKQGRLEAAIGHFSEALRIQPEYAEAHNNLGIAMARARSLEDSVGHFSEAVRLQPGMAEAHNNLGLALAHQGYLKQAIGHFSAALRIKPDYADARHNLDLTLKEQHKIEAGR